MKKLLDEFDVKKVIKWSPRDVKGAPVICMPNVPHPMHGLPPRVALGKKWWDTTRKKCYADAGLKCEVCGSKVGADIEKRQLHGHELYRVNYRTGELEFVKAVALCALCHILGVHTGRAITMYKNGNPLFPKEALLDGAENCFRLVSEYNKAHPKEQPLRVYATWINYLKQPELEKPMRKLIEKYDMKFYIENTNRMADWGEWKLKVGDRYFPSPYQNEKEWEEAMAKANKADTDRRVANRFTGPVYEEIDKINNYLGGTK